MKFDIEDDLDLYKIAESGQWGDFQRHMGM